MPDKYPAVAAAVLPEVVPTPQVVLAPEVR